MVGKWIKYGLKLSRTSPLTKQKLTLSSPRLLITCSFKLLYCDLVKLELPLTNKNQDRLRSQLKNIPYSYIYSYDFSKQKNILSKDEWKALSRDGGGGGKLLYESDGDACRIIRINTLKETNLGVAPALFNPKGDHETQYNIDIS